MDLPTALETLEMLGQGKVVSREAVINASRVVTQAWRAGKLGKRPKNPLDGSPEFVAFWDKYPKKVSRKAALKAWQTANPGLDLVVVIMQALDRHCGKWAGKDESFIPHASTWLNGERWVDELPKEKQQDMTAAPIYKNWPYNTPTNRKESHEEYVTRMEALRRI